MNVVPVGVEGTVDLFVGSALRDARLAHHIQCKDALWNEILCSGDREGWVAGRQAGDEVVLERLDCTFSVVGSVVAGWR
jgi:hypothetical protein